MLLSVNVVMVAVIVGYIPYFDHTLFFRSRGLVLKELHEQSVRVSCINTSLKGCIYAGWDESYFIPLLLELKLYRCVSTSDNTQYSLCLIPGKSAKGTKKSGSKHLFIAFCGVHGRTVFHAEHKAIVYFTKLATKELLQDRNGNRKRIQMLMFNPAVRLQSFLIAYNTKGSNCVIYLHYSPLCPAVHNTNYIGPEYWLNVPKSNVTINEKGKRRATYIHADRWAGHYAVAAVRTRDIYNGTTV